MTAIYSLGLYLLLNYFLHELFLAALSRSCCPSVSMSVYCFGILDAAMLSANFCYSLAMF